MSYATDSSEIDAGFGGSPTVVPQHWLWRLNPSLGFEAIAQQLQQPSFRRLQAERVAVDVDVLRVPPLEPLRAVGVEHRDDVERERGEDPLHRRVAAMPLEVVEDVEERRRRGRLVAVHLRPEQDAERAGTDGHHVDRAAFERLAHALEDEPVGSAAATAVRRRSTSS